MDIKYVKYDDYLLPNLTVKCKYGVVNKYGYLRLDYLKNHKSGLYQQLLMQGKLLEHLFSVSNEAQNKLDFLMKSYQKKFELSEKRKEINQLEWVKLMNNYKNCAEEIILKELVYK